MPRIGKGWTKRLEQGQVVNQAPKENVSWFSPLSVFFLDPRFLSR
jgi:hypothetical protein